MIHLLNNNCIDVVDIDKEAGDNSGDIFFQGGEIYTGELVDNLPVGQGILNMRDGSVFKGNFENKTMQEGEFVHFSGLKFKGTFNRDRFYKGVLKFVDGDYLRGEWGSKKGRWVLKKGKFFSDQNKLIFTFNSHNTVY